MTTQPDDTARWVAALTPDEVTAMIARAIEARDWEGVEALLRILAVKDPGQAQIVYDMIIFVAAADAAEPGEDSDHG